MDFVKTRGKSKMTVGPMRRTMNKYDLGDDADSLLKEKKWEAYNQDLGRTSGETLTDQRIAK